MLLIADTRKESSTVEELWMVNRRGAGHGVEVDGCKEDDVEEKVEEVEL